jgi:hypothetical protein
MTSADRSRWLEPSPPLAVDDDAGQSERVHEIRVRDHRARFGDPEHSVAECTCGWTSDPHTGRFAARAALREGRAHVEAKLPPYGHRGRGPAGGSLPFQPAG